MNRLQDSVVFPSKLDTWLGVVLGTAVLASLGAAAGLLIAFGVSRLFLALVFVGVGALLPLWILSTTRYYVSRTDLYITSGPFRWRIPLHEIRDVTPTRNPLSSPALSLDRLRIDYGSGKSIMVSPRDREAFVARLMERR
jgi:hypothetical protein